MDSSSGKSTFNRCAICSGLHAAGPGQISLSPASILGATPPERLVLPSPNGSAICAELEAGGVVVVAASLRNAGAVGRWLSGQQAAVGIVAAGERWPDDGSLRPAVEDLWGAGAVVEALVTHGPTTTVSPEAEAARTASGVVRADLPRQLAACASGVELIVKGFAADVAIAAELDVSAVVPVLTDGWFAPALTDRGLRSAPPTQGRIRP
ncbi:MAG TPA: 2-phosphosulfolactate phosphatase [Ornithinibacter sp.]|jgi:2-phosphosulfolactate phosphatase|uniref:2-phosphosulfolactate phosphatase n=1 Tax=Ornithinibacter sp. TaxID=2862748 RepID=UPI002CA849B9|nr:2-phosphosulfolactate phosphatase [Ornithinibacter sp.]HQV82591.1 2-phosphosulfolactate phosphatase [Ornithinibacter sp.]HQW73243.1 2-phosphosulfolactate phosphatase [Ornithinibacter sp.]HQX87361.1 2-phosphosulfolactate phosphatase [Ornithinibacter sp.]HQZ08999.1 2-phosphosulfolactate phosphatase [Ornithinibacter sp.]HRA26876.1 2-phosphosulfolactate phosphatase [Ornithinibacter sp.]